jgi:integrase
MARIHLTERSIEKLVAPDPSGRQAYYWDDILRGFGVMVSGTSKTKTFIIQCDVHGRSKRVKVGSAVEFSLTKAKDRASDMLDDLKQGIDPRSKVDPNISLQAALDLYLASSAKLRPASIRVYRQIERVLATWVDRPLRSIDADMIEKKHSGIASKNGAITANVTMRTLRIVWNHVAERVADTPANPVRRLKKQWFEEKRRTRMLSKEQIPLFYRTVCELENKISADLILLLMFTGLRKGEASQLSWENVDLKQRVITLPAASTKSGKEQKLPMSDQVADILIARRALGKDRYVFPGPGKSGHLSDLQRPFIAIAEQTSITISAHDLRRGFVTVAESIGTPLSVIKALVGHAPSRDVTAGYVVRNVEDLREPVQRIADRLKELCGIEAPAGDNIERLARK